MFELHGQQEYPQRYSGTDICADSPLVYLASSDEERPHASIYMSPVAEDASQLAPSQFAHLKTTQPTTTASGVTPGRALLDTPSPDNSTPVLERFQRSRKPSARKAEASQSQSSTLKHKGKGRAAVTVNQNLEDASNASMPKSSANLESQANKAGDRHSNDDDDDFLSPTVIEFVEGFVGPIDHLTHLQIQDLLDAMPETQASAMETQAEFPSTITKPTAAVGLAGRDRNGSGSDEGSGARISPQNPNDSTAGDKALNSHKRPRDASTAFAKSKRVRLSLEDNNSATEDESDDDSNPPRRGRAHPSDDDDEDDDDDDDDEPLPPLPAPLFQSRNLSTSSQGHAPTKATYPKSMLTTQKATSSTRLSSTRLSSQTSTDRIASTSSYKPPSSSLHFDAGAYLAHHPPPNDLNNIDALAAWAIQLANQQAQGLYSAGPSSHSHPPSQRTATTDHITRAIAGHRSRFNQTGASSPQNPSSLPSQSSSTSPTPRLSASGGDNPPGPNTDIVLGQSKPKRSAKPKLSDYPGIGEVASAAIPYFLATVFAEGAYENLETFRSWALDSYRLTWELEFPEYEYEAPPKDVLTIMTRRVSWLRGEVKKRIRVIVEYGHGFRNPATSRVDIKHNRRLAKKLGPEAFHCRDLVPNTDHFEHPQFVRAIGAGLFWDPESLGVVFKDRFKVVPIPAVALILTMMQACIDEWRLGSFKSIDLDADKQQVEYERHLLGLYQYEVTAEPRLTRFRKNWFVAGMEFSGAQPEEDSNVVESYVLASQIRPATPPPEPEHADD
ncbi:hypothetical protein BDV93DRAFT_596573 [Ceratobasidium sp. AG-I]|nr:hypothetical protein BDV93DRAFT_596573 [Ceratobasidium sp. AG-I]